MSCRAEQKKPDTVQWEIRRGLVPYRQCCGSVIISFGSGSTVLKSCLMDPDPGGDLIMDPQAGSGSYLDMINKKYDVKWVPTLINH
jgi:hypothetical protein